jgi:hypothetical protein
LQEAEKLLARRRADLAVTQGYGGEGVGYVRERLQTEQLAGEEDRGDPILSILERFHHLHQTGVEGEEMLSRAPLEEQDLVPAIAGRSKHTAQTLDLLARQAVKQRSL